MAFGWQTTPAMDYALAGGWALLRSSQGFLSDTNGVLFPREWLKRQELDVLSEQFLGRYDGEPVVLLELHRPEEIQGCVWQGLRQILMQDDRELFPMLGYAEQIGAWRRQHRFCGN